MWEKSVQEGKVINAQVKQKILVKVDRDNAIGFLTNEAFKKNSER